MSSLPMGPKRHDPTVRLQIDDKGALTIAGVGDGPAPDNAANQYLAKLHSFAVEDLHKACANAWVDESYDGDDVTGEATTTETRRPIVRINAFRHRPRDPLTLHLDYLMPGEEEHPEDPGGNVLVGYMDDDAVRQFLRLLDPRVHSLTEPVIQDAVLAGIFGMDEAVNTMLKIQVEPARREEIVEGVAVLLALHEDPKVSQFSIEGDWITYAGLPSPAL